MSSGDTIGELIDLALGRQAAFAKADLATEARLGARYDMLFERLRTDPAVLNGELATILRLRQLERFHLEVVAAAQRTRDEATQGLGRTHKTAQLTKYAPLGGPTQPAKPQFLDQAA